MQLAFGLRFNDLYEREGLAARRRRVPRLPRRSRRRAARQAASRRGRRRPRAKDESDLLVALAPHVEDFIAQAVRHRGRGAARWPRATTSSRRSTRSSACSCSAARCTRSSREDAKPDGFDFSTELDFAQRVTAWLKDETANAAKLEAAARYAAWAATHARGQGEASQRRAVQDAAQARLHAPRSGAHGDAPRLPRAHARPSAAARRLRAHRRGHRPRRRARRGQLLHLVPRAGQGLLLEGAEGEGARRRASARPSSACRSPAARSRRRSPSSTW